VDVNTGCGSGFVILDDDESLSGYELEFDGVVTQYPASTDTIFNLQNGEYTLSVYDSIVEQINFTVDAITIEAELTVPNTYLYIIDPYIVPVLNVYSPYTNVIWDFGDGTIFTGDLNPVHAYLSEGIYTLRVTIYSGECYRTIESIITVVPVPTGIHEVPSKIKQIRNSRWDLLGRQIR
jgi:PKD repeat protein